MIKLFGFMFVVSILLIRLPSAMAGPPSSEESMVDLPGLIRGRIENYWVAPNVRVSEESVGKGNRMMRVTWFDETGEINRQSVVGHVQPGFISTTSRQLPGFIKPQSSTSLLRPFEFRNEVQGVNENWKITLPYRENGYITSTRDSRVFVHEFHPRPDQIALDIYLHGKLARTVGPFLQHVVERVQLNEDGSGALMVWNDAAKTSARILALNTNGANGFEVDCEIKDHSPIPAPAGAGVLMCQDGGVSNVFNWYTRAGKVRSMEIGPNAYCAGWVPESCKSLFRTSIGEEDRYQLVDWETGKSLWEQALNGKVVAIGFTRKLIIFAVAELYKPGPWRGSAWTLQNSGKEWVQSFYAVDVQDGKTVAKWRAETPMQFWTNEMDNFLRLNGKLFFITPSEFTELKEDEVFAKKKGWRTP